MEISLTLAKILSVITPWILPASGILLVIGIIVDILNKKFHWSKYALIFFVVSIILLVIQFKLIYSVTGNIINNPSVTPQPTTQGGEVTLVGVQTCLPHKDTDGQQTLECALGLKTDDNKYYALDLSIVDMLSLPAEKKVTIKGTLVPMAADRLQKYNAVGIVKVLSVEINED